jgi:hypothetical protein
MRYEYFLDATKQEQQRVYRHDRCRDDCMASSPDGTGLSRASGDRVEPPGYLSTLRIPQALCRHDLHILKFWKRVPTPCHIRSTLTFTLTAEGGVCRPTPDLEALKSLFGGTR